jgi:hypothetical protein
MQPKYIEVFSKQAWNQDTFVCSSKQATRQLPEVGVYMHTQQYGQGDPKPSGLEPSS